MYPRTSRMIARAGSRVINRGLSHQVPPVCGLGQTAGLVAHEDPPVAAAGLRRRLGRITAIRAQDQVAVVLSSTRGDGSFAGATLIDGPMPTHLIEVFETIVDQQARLAGLGRRCASCAARRPRHQPHHFRSSPAPKLGPARSQPTRVTAASTSLPPPAFGPRPARRTVPTR